MNKSFFVIIGIVFLLGISIVSATEIGYIVKNSVSPNPEIIQVLNDKGYTYELISDLEIPLTDFSNYEMILVWDETLENFEEIPVNEMKSFVGNLYYLSEWDIAKSVSARTSTGYEYGEILENNIITEGLPEIMRLYDERKIELNYLPKFLYRAHGIENIVARDHFDANPLIGIIQIGGELYGGGTAEAKTLIFTLTKTEYWTEDSRILFENSIKWLIGEDNDEDGYYNDVDCDDNDASINPGSLDIYKNCINDAPIAEVIEKIIVSEGEIVEVVVDASDPEEDELIYEINDTRFEINENILSWQTGFEDYGEYVFSIEVSDGEFSDYLEVEVEVGNTNRIPVCDAIPTLSWLEDENISLNLNDYCSDPDGELVGFVVESTSEEEFVTLDSLDEGIANFSSEKDWNGEDWIIFKISDGKGEILTNTIILEVLPVNDEPVFGEIIQNITWDEDVNLEDILDLNDYFSDIDSELNFYVNGNNNVQVVIENGVVSLIPDEDWYGEETIIFSVYDREFIIYSNIVLLTVLDKNEAPKIINESYFEVSLDEDFGSWTFDLTEYESDFEDSGEDLVWSIDYIDGEFNAEITDINEDVLTLNSIDDEVCLSGCGLSLILTDSEEMYDEAYFNVYILPVNDAPVIRDYSPQKNIKILEDRDKRFEVEAGDIDSEVSGEWFKDGISVGIGFNYIFNDNEGDYNLTVIISDEEFNVSNSWEIEVGDTKEFKCEEVGGFVFDEHEVCLGDLIEVYDIDNCCSVPASFGFNDVGRCEIINHDIKITIKYPDEDDEFNPGDLILGELKLKNNFEEDKDFDVEVYLYDMSDNDEVEEFEDSIDIDEGDDLKVEFELQIPEDLDTGNNYAIFVKIIEEDDEYCNNEFIEMDIKRDKYDLIFEEIVINPESIECGDDIIIKSKIKNIGRKDGEAYIMIENSELNISQKSEIFEIEKYDDEDEWIETFELIIPENIDAGEYLVEVGLIFADKEVIETKTFSISECEIFEQKISGVEQIKLGIDNEEVQVKNNSKIYFIFGFITVILLLILIVLMILMILFII